jgi:hypothetical protein
MKAQPKAGEKVRLALAEIYKDSDVAKKRGHDIFEAGELAKVDCASNDELKVKYGLDVYDNVLMRKSTTEGARQACGDHADKIFKKMLRAIKEDDAQKRGEKKGARATHDKAQEDIIAHAKAVKSNEGLATFTN